MDNLKLGEIITTEQNRDAIHIAVIPVEAGQKLLPGERVWMDGGKAMLGAIGSIGVVDPFLRLDFAVQPGQKFWLYLNPGSITSLRHEWTHPAFEKPAIVETAPSAAEKTIRDMAENMGLSYGALVEFGRDHAQDYDDGYVVQQGDESWRDNFNAEAFWPAYEAVTGEKVPENKRDHFFSCSC